MAKLRETSINKMLTLKKDNDSNDISNDIIISNNDGELNINKNLNVNLDVSANSLTLPGGGIYINNNTDTFKNVVSYKPDVQIKKRPMSTSNVYLVDRSQ